jgi:hypothetical protein
VVRRALSLYTSIGKRPIHLTKELPGHVANRFQAALYREMLYVIDQGILSVEDTDAAVCYGPGLRWGVMGQSLRWHLGGGAGGIDGGPWRSKRHARARAKRLSAESSRKPLGGRSINSLKTKTEC